MGRGLAATAEGLHCSERTLRRYVNEGLLRGERRGRREVTLPYGEERYLRQHWEILEQPTLGAAHGAQRPPCGPLWVDGCRRRSSDSDVDLLIDHATGDLEEVVELRRRLQEHVAKPVHLVLLQDASPLLLADVLIEGRVIVDRGDAWRRLARTRQTVRRRAAEEEEAIHDAAWQGVAAAHRRIHAR